MALCQAKKLKPKRGPVRENRPGKGSPAVEKKIGDGDRRESKSGEVEKKKLVKIMAGGKRGPAPVGGLARDRCKGRKRIRVSRN